MRRDRPRLCGAPLRAAPRPGHQRMAQLFPHRNCERSAPYFFTLLASILMAGSSILVVNAVVTSNGFSMPR